MSWATENKFLTGYCIIMALGAGALGYQVFTANGVYDDASTKYKAKATTYNNLRKSAPSPDPGNLAVLEEQKKQAAEVVSDFQKELAKREFPMDLMSPADFQETLRKTVIAVRTKADAAAVILGKSNDLTKPEKFYLGFQRYEQGPPGQHVASILGRDLKAIEWVVEQLIATPVLQIKEIKRPELPEERGAAAPPARPAAGPGKGPAATPAANLVTGHSFEVIFTCRQPQLAKALNTIINPGAPQFLIPRNVRVINSSMKAPPRVNASAAAAAAFSSAPVPATPDPTAPPGQATPAPAAPGAPPAGAPIPAVPAAASTTITYLLGEEIVEVTLKLDIIDFAEPAPEPAAPAAPATPARGR